MATTQIEFISFDPRDHGRTHKENRRKVRIQVMKDFRRKERERQAVEPATSKSGIAMHTPRLSPHIYSPAVNQVALTHKLREGWAPIGFGFSKLVPAVVRSWAPVLAVIDSIKLVHLGSTVLDDRLVLEGRKRFLLAMNCLQHNLKQEPDMALPGLMLVSMGVSLNEIYRAISPASSPSFWQKQIVGMSALLLKQRPIDLSSRLETFMIGRLRTAQLMHSLCNRTPFPTEYAAPPLPSQSSALDFLYDLAFRVPGLLAIADAVIVSNALESSGYDSAVRDLFAMGKLLDSWLKSFCKPAMGQEDDVSPSCRQRILVSSKQPTSHLLFALTCESLCRVCLLLICHSLHTLHVRHGSSEEERRISLSTATACAQELYATTMSLERIAERPVCKALALRGPLYFLSKYYQSMEDPAGLELCLKMGEEIRAKAPYLNWDSLLPWALLPLVKVTA